MYAAVPLSLGLGPLSLRGEGYSQCAFHTYLQGLIFVVDRNDGERIGEAREELQKMVKGLTKTCRLHLSNLFCFISLTTHLAAVFPIYCLTSPLPFLFLPPPFLLPSSFLLPSPFSSSLPLSSSPPPFLLPSPFPLLPPLSLQLEEDELKDTLLLVFSNKQDLPNSLSVSEVQEKLGLQQLRNKSVSTWESHCVSECFTCSVVPQRTHMHTHTYTHTRTYIHTCTHTYTRSGSFRLHVPHRVLDCMKDSTGYHQNSLSDDEHFVFTNSFFFSLIYHHYVVMFSF